MKTTLTTILALLICTTVFAQEEEKTEPDTVIYTKGKEIRVFGDSWTYSKTEDGRWVLDFEDDDGHEVRIRTRRNSFRAGFATDLGINIWPQGSEGAPDVKPWGSWNVGLNLSGIQSIGKNFEIKTLAGVSWYNFKFEDTNIIAVKTPEGLEFQGFMGDGVGTKSKISASYMNLTLVPTIKTNNQKLRLGVGGYIGYRIGGRGKFVYNDDNGDKQKIFEKSNMYVEDFRYGLRGEIGVGSINFFVNYDMNELFQEDLGPAVQAISFGLTTFDIN